MQSVQLSLFSLTPQNDSITLEFHTADRVKAEHLRQIGHKMQKAIDAKKNSAISQQRPTARRARIAHKIYQEGLGLEQIQSWLYAMADAASVGTLPDVLNRINSRTQLEIFLSFSKDPWTDEDILEIFATEKYADWRSCLAKAGICSLTQIKSALAALEQIYYSPKPDPVKLQIERLERDIIGHKIPGYFPTPKAIVQKMVQLADLYSGLRVLEPSAGKGDIAQVIQANTNVNIDVVEIQPCLRDILQLKGFNIIGCNFLTEVNGEHYNRIIMNPPFEQAQDIEHVLHAYSCLIPGGRLVTIVSNAVTYRQDKKYSQFREWLSSVKGENYELPDGAFLESDRPTNVKTRLLVVDKPLLV